VLYIFACKFYLFFYNRGLTLYLCTWICGGYNKWMNEWMNCNWTHMIYVWLFILYFIACDYINFYSRCLTLYLCTWIYGRHDKMMNEWMNTSITDCNEMKTGRLQMQQGTKPHRPGRTITCYYCGLVLHQKHLQVCREVSYFFFAFFFAHVIFWAWANSQIDQWRVRVHVHLVTINATGYHWKIKWRWMHPVACVSQIKTTIIASFTTTSLRVYVTQATSLHVSALMSHHQVSTNTIH
jgi:hypothetical protein